MYEKVLGKHYDLSVVFTTTQKMQALNGNWRKKDNATDVLSFSLSKTSGEIYLCMQEVQKRSGAFGMSEREYLGYLFIHAMLHLRGYDHGRTMSVLERKYCRAFSFPAPE